MAKVISIHRETDLELPDTFTVGMVPSIDGAVVEHNPVVKSIAFLETGVSGIFNARDRSGCYLVKFEDSNVTRVIPADQVAEVAYESEEKTKKSALKKAEADAPAAEATEGAE